MAYEEIYTKNEKKISYVRYGEWTENVILFFHGFTGSKQYIPESQTGREICILSFDRPGIGKSDVQEYYMMEDFLSSVNAVLDAQNVKSVQLIGHSAGGYYAQVFAEMYPEKVKSLSLISSIIPLNCPKTKKLLNGQWKMIKFLTLHTKSFSKFYFKKMSEQIIKDYDKQLEANLNTISEKERAFMSGNYDFVKNATFNAVANNGLGVYYDAYALCQKRKDVQVPDSIPVFIWNGTADDTTPVSFAEYLGKKYNAANVHIIENIGHMLYLPLWDEILQEILNV